MKFGAYLVFAVCFTFVTPALAAKKKVKTPPETKLFQTATAVEQERCGAGSCWIVMSEVTCTWVNDAKRTNYKCSYKNDAGEKKTVTGGKAGRLTRAIEKVSRVDNNCGAGTCGYSVAQNISCKRSTGTPNASCTVTDHVAGVPKAPVNPGVDPARATN